MEWICGNGIAEIGGKKNKFAIGLWQCHCQNREKKLWQLWKKLWQLWQCHCRKWEEKKNSGWSTQ